MLQLQIKVVLEVAYYSQAILKLKPQLFKQVAIIVIRKDIVIIDFKLVIQIIFVNVIIKVIIVVIKVQVFRIFQVHH